MSNETFTVTEAIVLAPGGDTDTDGVIDPGETVRISVHITNNSTNPSATVATGLEFSQILNGMTLVNQAGNDVNVSPVAFDDSYAAIGNTLLEVGNATAQTGPQSSVAGHVTDNDLEFFGDTFTISAFQATSAQAGTVTMVTSGADMGSFTYVSAAGFTGTDTFTYTIRDKGLDGVAGNADDLVNTATVTVTVANQVWYVDASLGVNGNGTSTNPFNTLANVNNAGADADDANDFISLRGSTTANFVLEAGQQLVGGGSALVVGGNTLLAAGSQATLTHAGVGVTLASGNTVAGLNLVGNADAGIGIADGGATVGSLTVSNVGISGQGGIIDIDQGGALNVTLTSAASTGSSGANGGVIDLAGVTGTGAGFTVTGATSITGTHGQNGIDIGGASTNLAVSFAGGTTLTTGAANAVNLSTNAGSTSFTNLDITTTSGAAFVANDAGTLTITGASNDIGTTTGTAVNLATIAVGTAGLNFATVSTNGAANGVLLTSVGQAAGSTGIDILGGTIVNASTRGVDIASTSADVAVAATISTTATGRSVEVTDSGRAVAGGSTIVFSGAIDENGLGINLDNNDQNTNGAVISFSGGLDIDSTSNTGFSATNGGTINVTGTNTINNTTGTGLNVQNTTIGASDLTFQQIAVNGAANGIVLNNTGTSGGLIVTGSDGVDAGTVPDTGSGGTIQNTTGDGISLTTTMDVFLGGMTITSNDGDGIGGSGVNGFVLDGVTISGNGTNDALDHSGINLIGLTGTAIAGSHPTEIRNSTITNNHEFELQITNSSGTLSDFRVTSSTISSNGATAVHGNLFNFLATGTASMGLTVAGSSFTGSTTAGQLTGTGVFADASGGTLNADIGTSTFTNNNVGVDVSAATNGVLTFNIHNNTITGSRGNGLNFFTNANHTATASGTIANNTVGTQGVAGSGSTLGRGIRASNEGSGTTTLLITGNTVQSIADFDGLFVFKGVTAGTMNATITNNIFRDIPSDRGMNVQTGTAGSVLNTSISGNQFINVVGTAGSVARVAELPPATPGVINITQASHAALAAANGLDTTTFAIGGTPQFGQPAPPLPLLAGDLPPDVLDSTPAGEGDIDGGTPDGGTGGEPIVEETQPDEPAGDGDETAPDPPAPDASVIVDDGYLSQAELAFFVDAAMQRWVATGLSAEQVAALEALTFSIVDMPGQWLGSFDNGVVSVDSDGAGRGWYADATPLEDSEFANLVSATRLTAVAGTPAAGRFDLLTTVLHEMGHALGLSDLADAASRDNLLYGYLFAGERRLPGDEADGATPGSVTQEAFAGSLIEVLPADGTSVAQDNIFNLPPGRSVDIQWDATVDLQTNQLIVNPTNSGTVEASNAVGFADVTSNIVTTTLDTLTLGGTVWNDNGAGGGVGGNGLKDGAEPGIDGVALSLFVDADNNDAPDTPGTALATGATAGGGNYSFTGLAPGNYIVRVDAGNFGAGNPLANRGSTTGEPDPDVGDPDTDNDDNGYLSGGAVFSHNITLAFNTEPTAGVGNDSNTTLDFGFAQANSLPAFTGLDGTPSFTEGGAAVVLDANATVSDPDLTGTNYAGATLTLARSGGANAADLFGTTGTLSFAGANVLVGAVTVGTFTQAGGTLVITFNANATQALVNSALQGLTYSNTSDNPGASAAIGYAFSDGNTGSQGVGGAGIANGSVTVSITAVDDPPVAQPDAVSTPENAIGTGSVFTNNGSGADADVDGPALTVSAVVGGTVGTQFDLPSGAKLTLNANGTYSYDPNGRFNYLISPTKAGDTSAVNTTATDSFDYTLLGGNTVTVTVTVTGVDGAGDQLWGDAGNNTITGTPAGEVFNLSQGGNDTATGLGGNDGFYMGAALNALDNLDGGDGILDQLGLQGNYGAPFVLGANHLVNIEMVVLLPGDDTRFGDTSGALYSYNLATVDANVGAGERLVVSFNRLRVGENVTFDGSAETNGRFRTFAGFGNDAITGGAQDDGFYFGNNGRWGAGDSVNGGAGTLDQLGLQGSYSGATAVTFGASQLVGIEMLVLLTGGDVRFGNPPGVGYSYDVTMHNGNVTPGAMFYVSANMLRANVPGVSDETLVFNGSAELDGHFTIYSGAGADTITGGLLADTIYGAGGADLLTGGGGSDTFTYIDAAHSTAAAKDQILDFATGDLIGLSAIDAITGGANDAFAFIGSAAFSNTAGELRAFNAGGGVWQVEGDIDGNGIADLVIAVTTGVPLTITDFVL